jgi:hypothetical protein
MRIYCPKSLHSGVFQALDASLCKHEFWVHGWSIGDKPRPSNVFEMTREQLENPDDNFFDAILVQSYEDYQLVKNFAKTIIYYDLMNGRGTGPEEIYKNPHVIPVFISTSCRMSHGIYGGLHKTIYPAVDEEFWGGWVGNDKEIVHVRNGFKEETPNSTGTSNRYVQTIR